MQRTGDELLAGAVLAGDQHARRSAGDLVDPLQQRHDGMTLADDLASRVELLEQRRILLLEVQVSQRIAQQHKNAIGVERLLHDVVGASLRRLDGSGERGMSTDHHDECPRVLRAQPAQHVEAIHASHLHVTEHEVRPKPVVFRKPIMPIGDRTNLVSFVLEQLTQGGANWCFVIDDENATVH